MSLSMHSMTTQSTHGTAGFKPMSVVRTRHLVCWLAVGIQKHAPAAGEERRQKR